MERRVLSRKDFLAAASARVAGPCTAEVLLTNTLLATGSEYAGELAPRYCPLHCLNELDANRLEFRPAYLADRRSFRGRLILSGLPDALIVRQRLRSKLTS